MSRQPTSPRRRVGRVSIYRHHRAWYTYHRAGGRAIRSGALASEAQAEIEASLLNARLAAEEAGMDLPSGPPTAVASPQSTGPPTISVDTLRQRFLDHHEHVLGSAVNTVSRYASATQHLVSFAQGQHLGDAMAISVSDFTQHLRRFQIAPNGHRKTAKRHLRDKGVKYILETCRSMYRFGQRQQLLPTDQPNPFTAFGISRLRVRDAKPVFVFDERQELAFFRAADPWALALHITLARTGVRPGELVHLLVEELDLVDGWLNVVNKPDLGWRIKTGCERRIPLVPELIELLRWVVASRKAGPVFLRPRRAAGRQAALTADRAGLVAIAQQRLNQRQRDRGRPLTRAEQGRIYATVWRDAGALPVGRVRNSFIRVAHKADIAATCPKSWRHTFATLLQQANVDVQVRQETLGHKPTSRDVGVLGMTGVYTHTSPAFQRQEVERAVRLRPRSLALIHPLIQGPMAGPPSKAARAAVSAAHGTEGPGNARP